MQNEIKTDLKDISPKKSAPIVLIIFSGLSFIPMIGVLFGSISIFISLFNFKRFKILFILGLSGILFTIIIYSTLNYFGNVHRGGVYDELRVEMNHYLLNEIKREIGNYECKYGAYPERLNDVLLVNDHLAIKDPVLHYAKDYQGDSLFYYKLSDDGYELFSIGFDGIPYTSDDIHPRDMSSVNELK
jgi:hypothetical protein